MKVVSVYNRYLNRGGEDEGFENEGRLLEKNGCEVTLITEQVRRPQGLVESAQLALDAIWSRSWYTKFERILKEKKPDVVHVHNFFPTMSPSIYYACRKARVPVVQTLHNSRLICPAASFYRQERVCQDCLGKTPPWPAVVHGCYQNSRARSGVIAAMLTVHRYLETWRKMVDVFIVATEFYRRKFIEGGIPEDKIMKKPFFIDPDPGMKENRGEYALFVGRLSPEKGVRTMLAAWERLGEIPLKVRGGGPLLSEVEEFAKTHPRVEVIPHRLEAQQWTALMRNARFLVWPSAGIFETFGLVAVDAFACGMPVIASRTGAMAEIVTDHRTGLQFSVGDPEDLAAKAAWAWSHPEEMEEMGRNARIEYETKYTAEGNFHLLMEVYRRAINGYTACLQ
ncbi:MAG: glycosyltransferase family 4 protein [Acidobacteriaceae bacterium]|nr:glycosyltransferase family 4 protein [Acidobacteriaceae bacterium]